MKRYGRYRANGGHSMGEPTMEALTRVVLIFAGLAFLFVTYMAWFHKR